MTEGLYVAAAYVVIPSQCSHWRGNPFPAPAGAESSKASLYWQK